MFLHFAYFITGTVLNLFSDYFFFLNFWSHNEFEKYCNLKFRALAILDIYIDHVKVEESEKKASEFSTKVSNFD